MTNSDPVLAVPIATTVPITGPSLTEGLDAISGIATLHDRAIPGTRAAISHIAIGPSGVHVIDAHDARGIVVRRDRRLFVGVQDRSDLLAAMKVPVDAVAAALGDLHLPISRALCFTAGEWPAGNPPFLLRGVWVGQPFPLFNLVAQPGRLQQSEIEFAQRRLDELLPATR